MEATLEPRLVMKGRDGIPFVEGAFFVAAYQRGYRWGRDEVRQLLEDLYANARDAEIGIRREYYLQPIVVLDRKDGTWELVDGQQRLTTLYLLTKYISTAVPGTSVDYWLTYETREGSRAYLDTLDPTLRDENIDFHHIADAYTAIEEWFREQGDEAGVAIEIRRALTNRVYVIWYQAPDDTDPNELFIRLNRDRIPLTDSELIKALVLSNSGAANGQTSRQQEIAAQWDGFERDLRDGEFWAFLTRTTTKRSTHIDFLFESMHPFPGIRQPPRYWTFEKVRKDIETRGAEAFWRDVVERHGLLSGWYRDRVLYHRIGYLVQVGDSIADLVEASRAQTHSAFQAGLVGRIRSRLGLTRSDISLLRYDTPKDAARCSEVLLLLNVETVVGVDPDSNAGGRFSFHAYAGADWSLEHIHAQNSQTLTKEAERRDWITAHLSKIRSTGWDQHLQADVNDLTAKMDAHLLMPPTKKDDVGFQDLLDQTFALFGAPGSESTGQDVHGLSNLALLQRDVNSKLNNAVFALKRERVLEVDASGGYILPCTRNVFLKYYTPSADQQLSIWSPQDQMSYYEKLLEVLTRPGADFLLPEHEAETVEETE